MTIMQQVKSGCQKKGSVMSDDTEPMLPGFDPPPEKPSTPKTRSQISLSQPDYEMARALSEHYNATISGTVSQILKHHVSTVLGLTDKKAVAAIMADYKANEEALKHG